MNLTRDQFIDWAEHVEHVWEGIFLRAAHENGLDFDSDVDDWNLYETGTNAGQPPYLSMTAGPAHVSYKADPMAVATAYKQFGESLGRLIAEAVAAGAFQPRLVEAAEAIKLMDENRALRRAK